LDLLRSAVVGDSVTASAASIAGLCDDGTGALASAEGTAVGRAVTVITTRAGDELSALGFARAAGGSRSSLVACSASTTDLQDLTNFEVGAASIHAGIGSDESTSIGAIGRCDLGTGIAGLDRNSLPSASSSSSTVVLTGGGDTRSTGSVRTLDSDRSAVVGDSVTASTTSIAGLGDDGAGALASGEGAAVGDAVKVPGARTSNELVAVTRENGGRCKESHAGDDECSGEFNHV